MQIKQSGTTWNVVGDDVIVLDLDGSMYLKVNGSGRVLWDRLAESATESELVQALVDEYGIDPGLAATDVANFLAELRRRKLLEPE